MRKDWILKYDGGSHALFKHLFWWLMIYLIFTFIMSYYGDWRKFMFINMINISLFALAYYTLRFWQIPRIYQSGRIRLFALSLFVSALIVYSLYWVLRFAILEHFITLYNQNPFSSFGEFMVRTIRFYSPAMLLLVWEYQHDKQQDIKRIRFLEKEKLATELKYLKAQINPHFLFNTLNNLYSFVVTESPKASELLERLTGILHYVFEGSQSKYVPLSTELGTIEDYLALEKVRYGDRLDVQYHTEGDLSIPVSPLILLSIIENAFKHGASGDIDNPKIDINVKVEGAKLHCIVWNSKSQYIGEINDEYKVGIGISNIKRQLLLLYPDKHELEIKDDEKKFTFSLMINTAL